MSKIAEKKSVFLCHCVYESFNASSSVKRSASLVIMQVIFQTLCVEQEN